MTRLDAGGWSGQAADGFHAFFDGEPARWIKSGDAFHAAAGALGNYATTLEWAQRQADEAIALWEQGQAATEQAKPAQAQANQQAAAATAAGTPTMAAAVPFSDPGEEPRARRPATCWAAHRN